jgi:arylsulfatase A-like enzyme
VLPPLLLAASWLAQAPPSERGNVLILVADDLGLDQLSLYGWADAPPTPNLVALAADGVLFLEAWGHPVCSPARAALQTGRHGFRTGIGAVIPTHDGGPALPLAEVTLPEMLDLGTGGAYAHAAIGKWHLGSSQVGGDLAPNLAGYGHFAGSLEGQVERYDHWRRVVDGVGATSSRYATSVCVDDALAWIHAQSRPWLCVVSFQAPHAPYHRPPPSLHTQVLPPGVPPDTCGAPGVDPRPFHRAAIQALDTEIGRLLGSLPRGERERTTVFFLADNGTDACVARAPTTNRAKATLYESGLRVPFVASGYGVSGRGTSRALVCELDLFATVAELAGVDLAATLPGLVIDSRSLVPCLADPARRARDWLYAESFTPNGPGSPVPLPPCPSEPVCQGSLGFFGPGTAALEACGPPLYGSLGQHTITWRLTGVPPRAPAWLLIGPYAPAWVPGVGATLVSPAPDAIVPVRAGLDGTLVGTTWTGSTSRQRHYQAVVADARVPGGLAVTNALRMDFLGSHSRAARLRRYKLIRHDPCREELYDLANDPFEQANLLARPLTTREQRAHGRLVGVLDALR